MEVMWRRTPDAKGLTGSEIRIGRWCVANLGNTSSPECGTAVGEMENRRTLARAWLKGRSLTRQAHNRGKATQRDTDTLEVVGSLLHRSLCFPESVHIPLEAGEGK